MYLEFQISDAITKLKLENKGYVGRPLYLDAQATTPLVIIHISFIQKSPITQLVDF